MEQAGTHVKCVVRLDRLRISSWCKRGIPVPKIKGFRTVRDIRLRQRGKPLVYGRLQEMRAESSTTTAYWQYERLKGWASHWRVTLVADDQTGITAEEAWVFYIHFRFPKLLLFELAFDFDVGSGIDEDFVRQHVLFGKSRFRPDRGGPGQLRYGSRSAGKLIRCYEKEAVNAYRVEVELHSSLLPRPRRDNRLEVIDTRWPEIAAAGFSIVPDHLEFVQLRYKALSDHLQRRFGKRGDVLLEQTRVHAARSLRSALGYLRRNGVHNPHRFLRPMTQINAVVERAIDEWAADFLRNPRELDEISGKTTDHRRRKPWVDSTSTTKKTNKSR
jgi:hypothetical protein